MSDIPPLIGNSGFGSKPSNNNCSEDDELISVSTLRKILKEETREAMKEEFEVTVIPTFHRMLCQLQQVKEQIELAARNFRDSVQSNRENELYTSQPRRLTLQFRNKLSLPILTGKEIKGEGCDFIEVALVDDISGEIVESEPEANAVVEIVPLALNDGEGETSEQFDNNIVGGRMSEKSLLAGDVVLALNKGIGTIRNVKFRNSSTWMKQNLFKLCARVVGSFNGIHIKEAKTGSFTVKDCRNEYYKKRDFPVLSDEIWRLKNITKNKENHERLQKENINTVEKFLLELFKDPDRLRDIAKMKAKNWEITVKHAQTCLDAKRISCFDDPQKKLVVVFNLVKQVLGVVSGGQYIEMKKLSSNEKEFARKLVVDALDNRNDDVSFDDESSVLHYFSSLHSSGDPAFSQWRDHNKGQNVETSRMIDECHLKKFSVSCQDICSSMNYAQDTTTEMHLVPENITDYNVMDNEPYMEHVTFSQAPETLPTEKLSDNEKEYAHKLVVDALNNKKDIVSCDDENFVRYFSSFHASVDPAGAQQMGHSNGKNIDIDRLIDECSHYSINVSCQDVCSTTNSTQATPREKDSVPENINYFNVMDNQLDVEHATFSQAPETLPLEQLSDNEEANASRRTHALDNWNNDEVSLHRIFASLHPSMDPTSSHAMGHIRGKNVEEPKIFSECNYNFPSISPNNILPQISSAGGTSSEMHPNRERSNALNVIDDKFLMEISRAHENPEDELILDDDTFSLYSSHLSYASLDHTSSARLEPPEGLDSESFGTTSQFYADAFSKYNMPSIDSVGAKPSEVHPGLLSIINSYMTDDRPLTKHVNPSASLEQSQLTAESDREQSGSPLFKKWYTLINVLSLTQKLRCLPNSLVPPKKRRLR